MKMKSHDDDTEVLVYIGQYGAIPLAVSRDLAPLETYMTYHRGLKPKEFKINKERMSFSRYMSEYEDLILSNFYGFKIPTQDIGIIEYEYEDLTRDIESLSSSLKYMAILFNRSEKFKNITKDIGTVVEDFESTLSHPKSIDKLSKYHMLSHPVIKCEIFDYLDIRLRYIERRSMDERYKYAIAKFD